MDVLGFEEGGDDDDAAGSGGEDLREGLGGDSADAEGGDFRADFPLHDGDFLEANGGAAELGGGGEKRAESDVVKAFGEGGAGLGERVGGTAEEEFRIVDFGLRIWGRGRLKAGMNSAVQGAVVLADVDAVGAELYGEGGVVVEDEGDAGGAAEGDELFRNALDGGEVVTFCPELEEICPAGEEGGGDGFCVFLRGVAEVENAV